MNCQHCNSELIHTDIYGSGRLSYFYGTAANGIRYPSTYQHIGDIYKCPRSEGFESEKEAEAYLKEIGETLESLGCDTWEYVCCGSGDHNGYSYTERDNHKDGYPC